MALVSPLIAGSETELAALALALGAARIGGPLSKAERRLAGQAAGLAVEPATRDAALAELHAGGDPLGEAFAVLRPPEVRRQDGIFWTPPEIVGPMVDWALAQGARRLVDPGSGSGRFSVAAARHDHGLQIVAIDLEPLGALMTRAALAANGVERATVLCADYLTVRLPPFAGKTAFVGNPPYVRHHDLPAATKAWAEAAGRHLGIKVSGLAGLHALFFLATALHASPGDVGCFVTSSEWLDVGYGAVVRDLLLNGLGGTALDLIDPRAVPFADAMTTALIACFEIGSVRAGIVARMVEKPADLKRLAEGRRVPLAELAAEHHWSPFFGAGHRRGERTVGSLFRVHRGFASGGNGYFLMTKVEAKERGLERWVKPAITAAAEIIEAGDVIRDDPSRKVVLDIPAGIDRAAEPGADAYLAEGEREGIDKRYLCAHRKPWWRIGLLAPAPIVASYMARQAPVFARNPDGLALLNIGHGLYPRQAMGEDEIAAIVSELNRARPGFAGSGRTYHGGLEKFEPREMEALVLP